MTKQVDRKSQPTTKAETSPATNSSLLLRVENLCKFFPIRSGFLQRVQGQVRAVNQLSFSIARGKTYSLVGESGCGKTTTGRSLLRLTEPTSGEVFFDGININRLKRRELQQLRQRMQIIFQDPFSSLNPRHTVYDIISEGIKIHRKLDKTLIRDEVLSLLHDVGLDAEYLQRYPHEFSGGQRQRIAIARALAVKPEFIVCDESVSALDVSIQAQIINLLQDLQQRKGLAYLFITHDLAVVRHISDRVGVMYLGQLMEEADTDELFTNPKHPYTKALLSAIPCIDPNKRLQRIALKGEIPSAANPPAGCPFHPRCPEAITACRNSHIPEAISSTGHKIRCIHFTRHKP